MSSRRKCIVCGESFLPKPLYECKDMPAESQNLPEEDDLANDKPITYRLCQCSGCGLLQFDCDPVSYYLDSTRAGERCDLLINMRRKQYKYLIEKYKLNNTKFLEIGAGKGGFLKTLKEMTEYHVEGYGLEHSSSFVEIANEQEKVNVQQGNPENPNTSINGAPFDVFMSFAYPARLMDPNAMLRLAYHNLKDEGIGLIQVPSLEHLLRPGGFYDITRDHVAYYSEDTLQFLLQKNGFEILEHGEVGEVYIYAIVKKRPPVDVSDIWKDVVPLAKSLRNFADNATNDGKKLAVWCAGHFAFTAISTAGIGDKVSYIIDNAEFKQGCYAPASHVPIFAPSHYREEPVDTILILGPIYVEEIIKEIHAKCSLYVSIAAMGRDGLKIIQ